MNARMTALAACAACVLALGPPARGQSALLPGQLYDQDKYVDANGQRRGFWYYVDTTDPAGGGNETWEVGNDLTKHIASVPGWPGPGDPDPRGHDANFPESWSWRDSRGWLWRWGKDASCWAGASSNILRYVTGEPSQYHEWVYENDYNGRWDHTWQQGDGTIDPMHAEGYDTDSAGASGGEWGSNPLYEMEDWLDDGLVMTLGVTDHNGDEINASSHIITCYGIDRTHRTITIACSDSEYNDHLNDRYDPDVAVRTFDFTYGPFVDANGDPYVDGDGVPFTRPDGTPLENVLHIHDYSTGLYRVNSYVSFVTNNWEGSGTGGNADMTGSATDWHDGGNWSTGHVPAGHPDGDFGSTHDDSRLPKVAFTNAGLVRVSTSDAEATRLIIRNPLSHVQVTPTGDLELGTFYVDWGLIEVQGALRANRGDLYNGGRLWVTGGWARIWQNLAGGGEILVSDGGSLRIDGNSYLNCSSSVEITGVGTAMTVGVDMILDGDGSAISVTGTNSSLTVEDDLEFTGADATITVDGINCLLDVSGDIELPRAGTTLTVRGAGSELALEHPLDVSGTVTIDDGASATCSFASFGAVARSLMHVTEGTFHVDYDLRMDHGDMTVTRGTVEVWRDTYVAGDGNDASLNILGGTLVTSDLRLAYGSDSIADLTLTNSAPRAGEIRFAGTGRSLVVGDSGAASVHQFNGTVTGAGAVYPYVVLGQYSGGSGTYRMYDGTLLADDLVVGGDGNGLFVQAGGTVQVDGELVLADGAASTGEYVMNGGRLDLNASATGDGDGAFIYNGGTWNMTGTAYAFATLNIAFGSKAKADVELTISNKTVSAEWMNIGNTERGILTLTGATVNVANVLTVGQGDFGKIDQRSGSVAADEVVVAATEGADNSHYMLQNGSLDANTIVVGALGHGKITQEGGTLTVDELVVGQDNDAILNSVHQSGGVATITGSLVLGQEAGSRGRYWLDGADESTILYSNDVYIGVAGHGSFDHSQGRHEVSGTGTFEVGAGGEGEYTMYDGRLITPATLIATGGTGLFEQRAGWHDAGVVEVGAGGTFGEYDLSGSGLLETDWLTVAGACDANFDQSGGTVIVRGDLVIARDAGTRGVMTRLGGTCTVQRDLLVAQGPGTEGRLTQADGACILSGDLIVARGSGATGTVAQTGGTCSVPGHVYVGYGSDSVGRYELGGEHLTGIRQTIGGNLYIGYGPGSEGTYVTRGGGIYTAVLEVAGDIIVGAGGTGTLIMNGGAIQGTGRLIITESTGSLQGSGEIFIPTTIGGSLTVGEYQDVRFNAPVTIGGTTTVDGFLQLNSDGTFHGPVINNRFLDLLGGVYLFEAPVTGTWMGSLSIGGPTTAEASIETGMLKLWAPLTTSSPVTAGSTEVQCEISHTEGDRDLGNMYVVGFMGMGGSYTMDGPGRLETLSLTNYSLFTQNAGEHVSGTVEIGGFNMMGPPGLYPAPGTHIITGGRLDVGRLLIGYSEFPGPGAPPGTLSLTDPAAEVYVSEELIMGEVGCLSLVLAGAAKSDPLDPWCASLSVDGNVELAGMLSLDWLLIDGDANCVFGGAYGVLSFTGSRTGVFDTVGGELAAYLDGSMFPNGVEYDDPNGEVKVHLYDLLPGDADLDGRVGRSDFHALEEAFDSPDPNWFGGDFNFDGLIDFRDYLTWKANVGDAVPGAVPEPATLLLICGAAAPVLLKRRRS